MKIIRSLLVTVVVATAGAVLTGCEGVSGIPYRSNTAAAAILGDRPARADAASTADNGSNNAPARGQTGTNAPIVVPVEAADSETSRYLRFSPVQVYVDGQGSERTVKVYSDVTPRCLSWRVSLVKDGKEYYHFIASNLSHLLGQVIPLAPLALEPDLPVPDKIVVTLVR